MEAARSSQLRFSRENVENDSAAASIVCGTDFSRGSTEAVEVAAAIAQRCHERLVLVHCVDGQTHGSLPGHLRDSLGLYARAQLHAERERLTEWNVNSSEVFRAGTPDEMLLDEAAKRNARLLVLAASSKRSGLQRLLGSVAVRVAQAADVPTLVVRCPDPLLGWARGKRRLRVVVGADLSAPSEEALRWVHWLSQIGPCDVVVVYLEPVIPPPAVGFYPSLLASDVELQTTRLEQRHFRQQVLGVLGSSGARVRLEKDWGRSDAHLIQIGTQERADLMVVGSHARRGWHRLGHSSVSRAVLHYAPPNVVCVPALTRHGSDSSSQKNSPQNPITP